MNFPDNPEDLVWIDTRPRIPHDINEVCAELARRVRHVEELAAQRKHAISPDIAADMLLCEYVADVLLYGNSGGANNPTILLPEEWYLADILGVIGQPDYLEPSSDRAWQIIRSRFDQKNNASLPTAPSQSSGRGRTR